MCLNNELLKTHTYLDSVFKGKLVVTVAAGLYLLKQCRCLLLMYTPSVFSPVATVAMLSHQTQGTSGQRLYKSVEQNIAIKVSDCRQQTIRSAQDFCWMQICIDYRPCVLVDFRRPAAGFRFTCRAVISVAKFCLTCSLLNIILTLSGTVCLEVGAPHAVSQAEPISTIVIVFSVFDLFVREAARCFDFGI